MDKLQIAVARAKEKNRAADSYKSKASDEGGKSFNASVVALDGEKLAESRVIAGLQDSHESEVFQLLRTKVLSKMRENGWRTLAITSPTDGQGKSTVTANIAIAASREVSQSVLLVDLDLRRPYLGDIFGLENIKAGIIELLKGEASYPEAMVKSKSEGLIILPGKSALRDSSKWMSDPRMLSLFKEFRTIKESIFVIYDLPPVIGQDDVLKTIDNFDCSLLVIGEGLNSAAEIKQASDVAKRTNFLGYVINKSNQIL